MYRRFFDSAKKRRYAAKETLSIPCCRSRDRCPLIKGDKMHHRMKGGFDL